MTAILWCVRIARASAEPRAPIHVEGFMSRITIHVINNSLEFVGGKEGSSDAVL
jgi:hypothetical protein